MTNLPEAVDAATLADLLGITPNRLNALARDGHVPKSGRGRFPIPEATRVYVAWCRANPSGRRVANPDHADAKSRLTTAQAELAEAKLARERGELLPAADVRAEWTALATDLRARLLAIPPRVASALGLDRDAAGRLDAEMRAALEDVADG